MGIGKNTAWIIAAIMAAIALSIGQQYGAFEEEKQRLGGLSARLGSDLRPLLDANRLNGTPRLRAEPDVLNAELQAGLSEQSAQLAVLRRQLPEALGAKQFLADLSAQAGNNEVELDGEEMSRAQTAFYHKSTFRLSLTGAEERLQKLRTGYGAMQRGISWHEWRWVATGEKAAAEARLSIYAVPFDRALQLAACDELPDTAIWLPPYSRWMEERREAFSQLCSLHSRVFSLVQMAAKYKALREEAIYLSEISGKLLQPAGD